MWTKKGHHNFVVAGQNERFQNSIQNFILLEVETGIVFASVALSSTTEVKRQRTHDNAIKAYTTAMHFLSQHPFRQPAAQYKLRDGLRRLKHLLFQLDETFRG